MRSHSVRQPQAFERVSKREMGAVVGAGSNAKNLVRSVTLLYSASRLELLFRSYKERLVRRYDAEICVAIEQYSPV